MIPLRKKKSQKKERTLYYNTTLFGQAPLVNLVFKFFYTFYYIFSISFSYRHNLTLFNKSSFPARQVSPEIISPGQPRKFSLYPYFLLMPAAFQNPLKLSSPTRHIFLKLKTAHLHPDFFKTAPMKKCPTPTLIFNAEIAYSFRPF